MMLGGSSTTTSLVGGLRSAVSVRTSAPNITPPRVRIARPADASPICANIGACALPIMLDLTRSTIRRATQVRLPQAAASLTLTTALSIAPLLAVAFATFQRFPTFKPLEVAIEQHLLKSLLPIDLAGAVLKYLHQFATNANGLTLVGSMFVLAGAVMMLLTVEGALNQMWDIKKARP